MNENTKKSCFVVMGFGEKTDFQTQRVLDLDKTYRVIIKPAVDSAGLECIRADDVIHSGVIDRPMYELLLNADVVVADLSTSNANAIYELGVRHALRPHTTVIIAEKEFKFPFDLSHVLIRHYEHLGKGIDAEEAERAKNDLKDAIEKLIKKQETDSPVYTFLPSLLPPNLAEVEQEEISGEGFKKPSEEESSTALLDAFHLARASSDFGQAKSILLKLKKKMPGDHYIIQQLAFVTYKSKDKDTLAALEEARTILSELHPETTNDKETLGLWGAIHKRIWEESGDGNSLNEAIRSYEKGYHLRNDHYNGINYAFLLNVRASISPPEEAITDFITAQRVRRCVIEICQRLLEQEVRDDEGNLDEAEMFWLRATLVEAWIGIGENEKAELIKSEALDKAPEDWMKESMEEQIEKLNSLLEESPLSNICETEDIKA